MGKITLELDKKELEKLVELIYLGEWLVNANRVDKHIKKYWPVQQLVYSKLESAGIKNVATKVAGQWDIEDEKHFELQPLIDEFVESGFWEELPHRLAMRDLIADIGVEKVSKMSGEQMLYAVHERVEKYMDEMENYGIDRLIIDESQSTASGKKRR